MLKDDIGGPTSTSAKRSYTYDFPMVSVAADIALFNLPKDGALRVALVRREAQSDAFPGAWALPGGFLKAEEDRDIEACVRRELLEEVGVAGSQLEFVGIYSDLNRDPRARVISVAYLSVILTDNPEIAPIEGTDVDAARWVRVSEILEDGHYDGIPLAFDHARIVQDARQALSALVPYGRRPDGPLNLLFAFLPEEFTLGEAQQAFAELKGIAVDPGNFRKYIAPFVEKAEGTRKTNTRRAQLFRHRAVDPTPKITSKDLKHVIDLALEADLRLADPFLRSLMGASTEVVKMVGQILITYGRHRDYSLACSQQPVLHVLDQASDRVLVSLRRDFEGDGLVVTARVEPTALDGLGLEGLEATPDKSDETKLQISPDSGIIGKLDEVIRRSRAALKKR